jgi:hypothetical protein
MRSFVPAPEFLAAIIVEGEIQSVRFWSAASDTLEAAPDAGKME